MTIRLGPPDLVRVLAALPDRTHEVTEVVRCAGDGGRALFAAAREHGVAHVVFDALGGAAALPEAMRAEVERLLALHALENELSLRALARSLEALDAAGVRAVVLKGPLLGERLYGSAFARPSIDIDLLVAETDFERARSALGAIGYRTGDAGPYAEPGKHHQILFHDAYPILELHFRAYAGFGTEIAAAPILSRAVRWESRAGPSALVLAPEDELVYLAVHGAAHRFTRLGWLFDLKLLASKMTPAQIERAASRARAWGYGRVLAFTARLLTELFGLSSKVVRPLGELRGVRGVIADRAVAEPRDATLRSATRFVYTLALCEGAAASARYASVASVEYAGRVVAARRGR